MAQVKERDDAKSINGTVQLDEVYWSGERHGGKRGRGSTNKVPFVAAVSLNEDGHPVAMNMIAPYQNKITLSIDVFTNLADKPISFDELVALDDNAMYSIKLQIKNTIKYII